MFYDSYYGLLIRREVGVVFVGWWEDVCLGDDHGARCFGMTLRWPRLVAMEEAAIPGTVQ